MWVYLVTVGVLGGVTAWIVGDAIWAFVKERRQRNVRLRADVEAWLTSYRERHPHGGDQ